MLWGITMPKVNIPKNTWIDSISTVFFDQGYHAGRYGIELYFSGGDCPSPEFAAEVVESVLKVRMNENPELYPIIRFRGLFSRTGAEDIRALIKLFSRWGFKVHVLMKDDTTVPWFDECYWKVVIIEKPRLLNVSANEVWYIPLQQTEVPEPAFPPNTDYKLYISKGLPQTTTLNFMCTCKRLWSLL